MNDSHLLGSSHFELMKHDVPCTLYVKVDQIYNLACSDRALLYHHDPVQKN